ncbi:SF3a splicing factor complex subunit PRP9 [Rhodotorula paludigena]|uniref:SF3a splicing factor complex subunit PRP9 n=1 Tax=Rhodotorula paludigena TaxID=86838 RepID=UPI003175A186
MASSVIEDARALAEDADLFERTLAALVASLEQSPLPPHRQRLATAHRAADLVDRTVARSDALVHALLPANDDRAREIDALAGGGDPGADLAEFYQRLAKVKDYHRKYPAQGNVRVGADRDVDFAALEQGDPEWLDKKFTGDEALGRYLDLHELHDQWNNLAPPSSSGQASAGGWKRYSYLQYLGAVTDFSLSPQLKASPAYAKYLTDLLAYLSGFYERVLPLGDLDAVLVAADADFARRWDAGLVPGWAQQAEETEEKKDGDGIWCAACQKSFTKESVYTAHLTGKKHVKAAAKLQNGSADSPSAPAAANGSASSAPPSSSSSLAALRHAKNRALALKEALVTSLLSSAPPSSASSSSTAVSEPGPLAQILADTQANTERRAALTDKERAAEIEELEAREAAEAAAAAAAKAAGPGAKAGAAADDDDEEGEGRIYNPLKLPLGWDGKPIPYWLYKLHGLGVEYKCEICSDHVYQGRKNFERHFQESRHAFGMRALGLPNTKHFHEITRIEDALALAEKLKQEGRQELSQAELTEELEDDEGNVYNRKTYEDLKRQGLV